MLIYTVFEENFYSEDCRIPLMKTTSEPYLSKVIKIYVTSMKMVRLDMETKV
jgi:hypothetical protein